MNDFRVVKIELLDLLPFQSRLSIEGQDFDLLVASVREKGVLEPLLARPKGERFEVVAGGRRLRAAQKAGLVEVPIHVRAMTDEEAIDVHLIENLDRADYTEEEKRTMLGNYARIRKLDARQIAEKLHKSYSWVVLYLPDEFKDKKMAELGAKGGEAKAATRLVATQKPSEQVAKVHDLHVCEFCGVKATQQVPVLDKDRWLCDIHALIAKGPPSENLIKLQKHFRYANGESASLEERLKSRPEKPYTETWEHRQGTMQTPDPEVEKLFSEEAQALGLHGFRIHPEIPVISVWPDNFHVETRTLFWMDNEELHKGKRSDKDEQYRGILEGRGFKNEVFVYKGEPSRAKVRGFLEAWKKKAGI